VSDNVASPESTGGSGFSYEQSEAAWWALCMLLGRPPLDTNLGVPLKLRLQARVDGWRLDDIVAEFPGANDRPKFAAVSAKKEPFVNRNGFNAEFVKECWQQLVQPGSTGFTPAEDRLVLCCGNLPSTVHDAVQGLVNLATGDPEHFMGRVREPRWTNGQVRTLVESFACPTDVAASQQQRDSQGTLLHCVRVVERDWLEVNSHWQAEALMQARGVVASGRESDAKQLWQILRRLAQELSGKAGSIDLMAITEAARGQVRLRPFPDFGLVWGAIRSSAEAWKSEVRTSLTGGFAVPRDELAARVQKGLDEHKLSVIVGSSGTGKSAVVRTALDRVAADQDPLIVAGRWSDLERLAVAYGDAFRDALIAAARSTAILVLDSAEQMLASPQEGNPVLRMLDALDVGASDSPWRLVVVTQTGSSDAVVGALEKAIRVFPVPRAVEVVDEFTDYQLRLAAVEFPALSPLLQHATQRRILARPVILDLVVRGLTSGVPGTFANLTTLHDWFWRQFVSREPGGDARAAVAKKLARNMAETGAHRVPVDSLSIPELNHLGELVQKGILTRSREVVAFAHDSYAALARERVLLGWVEANGVAGLPEKLTGWHDAVALLSLRLIEAEPVGGIEWEQLHTLLVERDPHGALFAATSELFAAADVAAAFERVLPTLLKDDGEPLQKMLRRTAFSWSVLRPDLADAVAELDPGIQWRIDSRIESRFPTGDHWPRLIAWLAQLPGAVFAQVRAEVFDLCRLWLTRALVFRSTGLRQSTTAADLILKEAEALCRNGGSYGGPPSERLITAALLCHAWFPNRTARAIRTLAGVEPFPRPSELCPRPRVPEPSQESQPSFWTLLHGKKPAPWELGPYGRPNAALRKVVLSSPGADYLVAIDPDVAQRVFNGALVMSPGERRDGRHTAATGIVDRVASPPTCWFPPVRALLAVDPALAVSFVVTLVDFATDRWLERDTQSSSESGCTLDLADGDERRYRGEAHVFAWSRGSSGGPDALKAALMTLEDWLYKSLCEETTQAAARQALRQLLDESCSVAVLGMLCDVGARFPALLLSDLQPLVTGRELYIWVVKRHSPLNTSMAGWWDEPSEDQKRIHEFHQLGHRGVDFRSLVGRIFVQSGFDWPAVTNARSRWLAAPVEDELYFEVLAALLDPSNWHGQEEEEDGTTWTLQLPDELEARANQERRLANELLGHSVTPFTWASMLSGKSAVDETAVVRELQRLVEELGGGQPQAEQTVAVAAVASVALVHCKAALEREPDLAQRCASWLLGMCSHPPPRGPLDHRDSATLASWEQFCAMGVAALWVQDPCDADTRRAVAMLAVGPRDGTPAKLLESVTPHRRKLGREFELLVDLVVFVARALHAIRRSRRHSQVHEWACALQQAIEAFVAGRTYTHAAAWDVVAAEEDPLGRFGRWGSRMRVRLRRLLRRPPDASVFAELEPWINMRDPLRALPEAPIPSGLHGTTALAAVSWLLDEIRLTDTPNAELEKAVKVLARVTVLPALHEAAQAPRRPGGGDRKPIPRNEDRGLTDIVAAHVARFPSAIDATIACYFDLPANCGHWLEDLIRSVYFEWLRHDIDFATRVDVLTRLVPHALRWFSDRPDSGYKWRDTDVLPCLLGTSCYRPVADVWPAEAGPSVATLAACLKSWWAVASDDPSCVAAFCGFLRAPGCSEIRGEGLSWLAPGHIGGLESVDWWIGEFVSLLELTAPAPPPPSTPAHWRALLDAACEQGDAGALALAERWHGPGG